MGKKMALMDLFELGRTLDREFTTVFRYIAGPQVVKDENTITFTLALPGIPREDIKVDIEDGNMLSIRTSMSHHRRSLPHGVDLDNPTVTYRDGLLKISFPRVNTRRSLAITEA